MTFSHHIIQRLSSLTNPASDKGFDGFFRCDYMGSAEYEFGAIPESLKRIRGGGRAVVAPVEISERTVYFVTQATDVVAYATSMLVWLAEGGRSKEMSYFPQILAGAGSDYMVSTDAWWDLAADIAWTLDANVAGQLVTAFNTPKPSTPKPATPDLLQALADSFAK